MKRYFKKILGVVLLAALAVLSSCRSNSFELTGDDKVQTFTLSLHQYENGGTSRAEGEITQLIAGIYDMQGVRLKDVGIAQSSDLRKMSVEGLRDGQYMALFVGVGEQRSTDKPALSLPERIDDVWLTAAENNEYLYAKNTFTITDGAGVNANVGLKRVVGRVDIEPNFTGQWAKGSIESIKIVLDDQTIYTTHSANDTYSGAGGISSTEIVETFNIYAMPTLGEEKRHGSLLVKGAHSDGTPYSVFYEFDIRIEPNKRAVIRPTYAIDADQFGNVHVYSADRTAANSRLMFQDPKNGVHNYPEIASHSFATNALLKLTFENSTLTARFYSHVAVKDVTVYVRRPNDVEFFEVAWFESVLALEERRIPLSANPNNRLYRTESGGTVFVDKMTGELEYKYVSTDAYMQKLASIKWPCRLRFIKPTSDTLKNSAAKLPFRAVHAREAIALWTNMGYVYSHPIWTEKMLEEERVNGPFLERGVPVPLKEVFFPKVFNKSASNFAELNILNSPLPGDLGLASVGSGDRLGLQQNRVYTGHYMDQDGDYYHYYDTSAHEYHHTLGYTHEGNFTYNRSTVVIVASYKALASELPYPSSKLLNSKSNPNLYQGMP